MANIRQRGNTYQISVYVGRDDKGKKICESMTFTPTETAPSKVQKEVEKAAMEFEERVKNGKYLKGDKLTFNQVIDYWKQDRAFKDLTLSIQEDYIRILNQRAVPVLGNIPVNKISPLHIQQIYNDMENEGRAPGTIKRVHVPINSVMKYAFRMEIIETNPCDRVRLPKLQKDDSLHYFDIDQAKIFLKALSGTFDVIHKGHTRKLKQTGENYTVPDYSYKMTVPYQFQVYFTIALYSGFRRGEMIALRWQDVNFDTKSISVNKSIAKTQSKGQIVKGTKTVSGNREIKLPDICFSMLKEWKAQQKELSLKLGTAWEGYRGKEFDDNYIFIRTEDHIGQHMGIDTPSHKFQQIIEMYNNSVDDPDLKLPVIRLHDLRHTSATLLLAKGVDIETVSHRLGHANPSVTLDVYGHALESMDEVASDTLGDLLAN